MSRMLTVTMRQPAADKAIQALDRAVGRLAPSFDPPVDEKGKADYEAVEWLKWLQGRILYAEMQALKGESA